MKSKNEKKEAPLKPYDDSMWDRYSMYDRMPYVWDPDLNVEKVFPECQVTLLKHTDAK